MPDLRQLLDDPEAAGPWLGSLGVADVRRGHANLLQMAEQRHDAGPLGRDLRSVGGVRPCLRRPGHGPEQPRPVRRRGPQSAGHGHALPARPRGPADAPANLLHQPAFQRPLGGGPGELRPSAADRGAAVRPAGAGRGHHQRGVGPGPRAVGAARPAAVQAPRDAADRLRRHRARAEPPDGDHADFVPGRRDSGSGAGGRLEEAPRPAGHPARGRRQPGPLRRPRHGQARRRGAELLQRHRPDLPLRRRRPDRRQAAYHQRRVLRPAGPGVRLAADDGHGAGHCLPRGPAAAARGAARPDRRERGRRAGVLRQPRAAPGSGRRYIKARPVAGDRRLWARSSCEADAVDLPPLPEPCGHQRHPGLEAEDRAAHRSAKGRGPGREDRTRRHPRRRVRHPVPAIAQRRRPAGPADRQHAGGPGPVGEGRLPAAPGADDPGGELQLPPQDRAPLADPVRSANPPPSRAARRDAQAGPAHGLRRRAGADRPGRLRSRVRASART